MTSSGRKNSPAKNATKTPPRRGYRIRSRIPRAVVAYVGRDEKSLFDKKKDAIADILSEDMKRLDAGVVFNDLIPWLTKNGDLIIQFIKLTRDVKPAVSDVAPPAKQRSHRGSKA